MHPTLSALRILLLCSLAGLLLAGCGDSSPPEVRGGVAVDPYIVDARFQEILADGSAGQLSTLSAEDGSFSFTQPLSPGSTIEMVAAGYHNNLPFQGHLATDVQLAQGETVVVSPLTTLLTNLMQDGLSAGQSQTTVREMLSATGLELSSKDLISNPMAGISAGAGYQGLQANIATNAFLLALERAGEDGYYLTEEGGYLRQIEDRQDVLFNMVAAIRSCLRPERRDNLQQELEVAGELPADWQPDGLPVIQATVAVAEHLAERAGEDLQEDGQLDTDLTTLISDQTVSDLVRNHYLAGHLGEDGFSQWLAEAAIDTEGIEDGQSFFLDEGGQIRPDWCYGNAAPVADAGTDLEAEMGVSSYYPVSLDGSASYDDDGDPLSYHWSFLSVPEQSQLTDFDLVAADTAASTFTPDVDGDFVLQLVVADHLISSQPDTVTITVSYGNAAPIADAGTDLEAGIGIFSYHSVNLDGSASYDDDGDPLNYDWSFLSVPEQSQLTDADLVAADTAAPTFIPDVAGDFVLQLVVADNLASSLPDTVSVTAPSCSGMGLCGF